ncbi:MAG: DEAD/DEAH box helicase [Planctomycetes bacterium]|nr:DEAD/DEAH box helicase [Planctomycetota bacterium]
MNPEEIFSPNGLISKKMPGYETRPQQVEMFKAVVKAINESQHLMVEAGTGVGKTFAYLIPAIAYACSARETREDTAEGINSQAVVISTHTINLQEQIFHKDLPLLKDILGVPFTSALVKGRNNYLCLRRLNRAANYQSELFETSLELEELSRLKEWSAKTKEGSLSDISWTPSDKVWSEVSCERDNCSGKKCTYYRQCFYRLARNAVWNADIIVVNHALLLMDALMREEENNILPNYDVAIIDEAHRLESVAQSHLGLDISNYRVNYLLNSIYNPRTNKGLLSFIPPKITPLRRCKESLQSARDAAECFFNSIIEWYENEAPENGRVRKKDFVPNPLSAELSRLHFDLKELKDELLKKKNMKGARKFDETELNAFLIRTASLALELENFVKQSDVSECEDSPSVNTTNTPNGVYWIEKRKSRFNRPNIILKSAPVSVAESLKKILFGRLKSVVLTSATLATAQKDGLGYLKKILGIEKTGEVILGSPFDYQKQVRMFLTRDMPDPNDKASFLPMAGERIMKYLNLSKGSAFVLFTSYDLMNRMYEHLYPELEKAGMAAYLQGKDLPRHKMLEEFKNRVGSVIFGADSFWQGVDVPGAALENIIITKLPFPVPSEPVVEAKIEKMEREGIDSFMGYFLPEAIIKLRQGFGRLIRTKTDKGMVVILDNRVVTKQYGRFFINALPKCETIVE